MQPIQSDIVSAAPHAVAEARPFLRRIATDYTSITLAKASGELRHRPTVKPHLFFPEAARGRLPRLLAGRPAYPVQTAA